MPPLDYELVRELKRERPELEIILNGGLRDLDHALGEGEGLDGVMLGRAAYQNAGTSARRRCACVRRDAARGLAR